MNSITDALLIAINTDSDSPELTRKYGGETLIGRSLIALTKSGIKNAVIVTRTGQGETVKSLVRSINPSRIEVSWTVVEKPEDTPLSDTIQTVTKAWQRSFLVLPGDRFLHPSFLLQTVKTEAPTLWTFAGCRLSAGVVEYDSTVKNKFKIMFEDPARLEAVTQKGDQITGSSREGSIHSGIMTLSAKEAAFSFKTVEEWRDELIRSGKLKAGTVRDGWWYRMHRSISNRTVRDFLWKIAFKEVSGEFSKAVNSKLSRPLSFWFAERGVKPDTISNLQLAGYVIGTAFLFYEAPWASIVFAVIWQFSAGVLDRCDGETARIRNYESESGAKMDVLADDLRFGLPFFALTGILYAQTQNPLYPAAGLLGTAWFLWFTIREIHYIRNAGYTSRQVFNVDFLKMAETENPGTVWIRRLQPLFKGDIRTVYVSVLALWNLKAAMFWTLCFYAVMLGIITHIGITRFERMRKKFTDMGTA